MHISKEGQTVIQLLKNHQFEAYVVGGAVRDYLLNKRPSDFDFATNALPEQIKDVFKSYTIIDKGLKHGTITVIINRKPQEITTFRADSQYLDHRHPSKVSFVNDLREDLSRRDFTINALAYDEKVIDYFEGQKDLKKRIIRCVGDPVQRFTEDALRILRALRFSCQLNFTIEEATSIAIFKCKDYLSKVSIERLVIELNKMLLSDITKVLQPYFEVFKVFIPELVQKDMECINLVIKNSEPNLVQRLSVFLYKSNEAMVIINRLKYPKLIQKKVMSILDNASLRISENKIDIKKILMNMSIEDFIEIIKFKKAIGENLNIDLILSIIDEVKNECYQLKDLAIKGSDIIKLGFPKNNSIAILLNDLLNKVIEEKVKNTKEDLLNYLKDKQ
jgi:tRNA nucleotidyltransferase (CCA-adding enzyme)